MTIYNMTQHRPTAEQCRDGVRDFTPETRAAVLSLLTFESLPLADEVYSRADALAELAEQAGAEYVLIGGAPFLMEALSVRLKKRGICPMFAFSRRCCEERVTENGTVEKNCVFRYEGMVVL